MRGAAAVEGGRAQPLQTAGRTVVFGTIGSPLDLTDAKEATPTVREAIGRPRGAETFVSGTPAIQARPRSDLRGGPAEGRGDRAPDRARRPARGLRALVRRADAVHRRRARTITATLGIVWIVAHYMTTAVYVTNLVQLIGLGIAIDYSLLIVYRFREELERGRLEGRGDRADDGDGRPGGRLLRRHGRDRPVAAPLHAVAVHGLDGRRRLPDPADVDRRGASRSSRRCSRSSAAAA